MSRIFLFAFLAVVFSIRAYTQSDSLQMGRTSIMMEGFIDLFYKSHLPSFKNIEGHSYLFNHNRYNEVNLNLGYFQLKMLHPAYRASFGMQTGTYAIDNYKTEPPVYGSIYEAQAGIRLAPQKELWLDAGIMTSPIGYESAVGMQNWTLTRSLVAENSPYYLAGAKITWQKNEKWRLGLMICNGWQRIQRVPGNSLPALATQITFKSTSEWEFNWSGFAGSDDPDSSRRMRYYNNLYIRKEVAGGWGFLFGLDLGFQQKIKSASTYHHWISPVFLLRFPLAEKWSGALRAEYFGDGNGVLIPAINTYAFKSTGWSLNLDHAPVPNIWCRLEGRLLQSRDPIFKQADRFSRSCIFLTAAIQVKLN